jgi:hypothetical protein
MSNRKTAARLDREIAEVLGGRRHHSTIRPDDDKERIIGLLRDSDPASREVARDILLKHGVIQTGRVTRFDHIGESFSGPIYQVNIGRKRYWMVYDPTYDAAKPLDEREFTRKIPGIGTVLDFTITDDLPPRATHWPSPTSKLKQQLHPAGGLLHAGKLPESLIRRWVEKWWIE